MEEPDIESTRDFPVYQSRKRALLSLFNHHYKSSKTGSISQTDQPATTVSVPESSSSTTTPYVYIDHEKTTTLKEIAEERLQQHSRRIDT